MDYAKGIRTVRAAKNISQAQLSEMLGMSRQAISAIETGQNNPSIETLEKISQACGIPLVLLILLSGDKQQSEMIPRELDCQLGISIIDWFANA